MNRFLLAIDDTDNLESKGTGWLARKLAKEIGKSFNANFYGVTRHQLFLHPDIPYTTHNSAACMDLSVVDYSLEEIFHFASTLVANLSAEGSDPGISLASVEGVSEYIQEFGRRAQQEVVTMVEAYGLAAQQNVMLKELGGTGQGIIGALAAIGLRTTGYDGRYLELRGIRELTGVVSVKQIIESTGICRVVDTNTTEVPDSDLVNTLEWLRPTHYNNQPVLFVKKDENNFWIPAEKPKRSEL